MPMAPSPSRSTCRLIRRAWMCPRPPGPKSRSISWCWPDACRIGRRSCRAVMLAVALIYVCGVSTREPVRVLAKFGSRACHQPQSAAPPSCSECGAVGTPHPTKRRQLGEIRYLLLGASSREIEAELKSLVASYRDSAPLLADWLEAAVPEAVAVRCCVSSPPCSSKSTKHGWLQRSPTSTGPPGCVIGPPTPLETSGCAIEGRLRLRRKALSFRGLLAGSAASSSCGRASGRCWRSRCRTIWSLARRKQAMPL